MPEEGDGSALVTEITPGGAVNDPNQAVFSMGGVQFAVQKDTDGIIRINNERYVPESDLIANKSANERRVAEQDESHKTELGKTISDGESTRQLLLQAQADRDSLQAKVNEGITNAEQVTRATTDTEAMKASLTTQTELALNFRKESMVQRYGLKPEQLAGKDMNTLTYFEEAMQAIGGANLQGGAGNLAVGGAGGGAPTPMTDMERAAAALEKADRQYVGSKST